MSTVTTAPLFVIIIHEPAVAAAARRGFDRTPQEGTPKDCDSPPPWPMRATSTPIRRFWTHQSANKNGEREVDRMMFTGVNCIIFIKVL
jgi:hypothetical protein